MRGVPGNYREAWPGGRAVVAVAAPEMCGVRLWTVASLRAWRRGRPDRQKLRGPPQKENNQGSHPAWPLGMPDRN